MYGLIETLWNVNAKKEVSRSNAHSGLIETLWNVNETPGGPEQ